MAEILNWSVEDPENLGSGATWLNNILRQLTNS